ncbi:opaque-specific ABC transporter CDR3 [Spathaspora passalidarum NRRL Y-27907]|uniref:Opaque-specific ABC transporter CDR3 n=1 Tax=Spathaspora passalidarum (strain NRRL Y-27907 / 11-Y1) TaxID=619300 RepID=G3AH65_SPAPN|nr:opaque-specific ABC transporter CDR3 [Spathaspora passalidarum NRRL Y-27907]EGW35495.1 opaque-specific ABC transporter CDR3 [Spathaspora passalidarum NRRL Y-27907]
MSHTNLSQGQPYNGYYSGFSCTQQRIRSLARISVAGDASRNYSDKGWINPITDKLDPRLDPQSPAFNSQNWVQNIWKLYQSDSDYYKPQTLGVGYKHLRAFGDAKYTAYQTTVSNGIIKYATRILRKLGYTDSESSWDILKPMEGLILPGELTVVLGRPGAGCSTLLKTLSCHTDGFRVADESIVSYDGITPKEIRRYLRGEVVYCGESEIHFPNLTVRQTLEFAALMKTPRNRPDGVSREAYAKHIVDVVMATYGLTHTKDTKIGNEFIRGVSGGERKRASIAEVSLVQAPFQCWDNSTRGLDSATALEFISSLRTSATVLNETPLVAIYQCSQPAYDLFDKVILLYEGYQIYFGSSKTAVDYFEKMGFVLAERQTVPDFLTSITNPAERLVKPGYERLVPRSPKEFYRYWRKSPERQKLLVEIDQYLASCGDYNKKQEVYDSMRAKQSKHTLRKTPYTVSLGKQIKYIIRRDWERMRGDWTVPVLTIFGNVAMSLILSSVFYNLQPTTSSFYYRTAVMYFALVFNSYSSVLEIYSIYQARPVVQKHRDYALYPPTAEAIGSIICDFPLKIISSICFNVALYFMVNFKREPGAFFFYLLINFVTTLYMSHLFRTIGAFTKSLAQAMTPSSLLLFATATFTGFAIPKPYMLGWCKWITYVNPMAYAFEALIANEFHGRQFNCSSFVPSGFGYPTSGESVVCSTLGSVPGSPYVLGDDYLAEAFGYYWKHAWMNFGILVAFVVFLFFTTLICMELNKDAVQGGEILVFKKKNLGYTRRLARDIETGSLEKLSDIYDFSSSCLDSELDEKMLGAGNIFHWKHLTYTLKVKSETKTILNDIDGWVKPGQVTALMGASGAGKTTLLNALSDRLTVGVVTSGQRKVNGNFLDNSFQRSIGYVQQQDLHLDTSTVREALRFSAYLRQENKYSDIEKEQYVENIIELMEMTDFADAVIGVPGEGLNVEQRKRLSIAVELVARPKILLFLDEPTSGLDSQTAWSICKLMRKLADHGQAILCTIHQPSARLLEEFDRLLFLQAGGQTVYFGELGHECETLIRYFESHGAPKCPRNANPAEWMLEIIGAAPGSRANQDYFKVWRESAEYHQLQDELYRLDSLAKRPKTTKQDSPSTYASPLIKQYRLVLQRLFEQYWRTPSYIYSKFAMAVFCSLFNGFSFFMSDNSIQGLRNQSLSLFMLFVVMTTLAQQYVPLFVTQRDLYEAREQPSKTFSWIAFIAAQITAEIPYQIVAATLSFVCWYYPLGLFRNASHTGTVTQRGGAMWFMMTLMFIFSSTLAQLCISFNQVADNAANFISFFLTICFTFCGLVATKDFMPKFWTFLYYLNPFTYLVSAIMSLGLADAPVVCNVNEYVTFRPELPGQKCKDYVGAYMVIAGGYLVNPESTDQCQYCPMNNTNQFLDMIFVSLNNLGRDIGVFMSFIIFNMAATVFFYWLVRVPKEKKIGSEEKRYERRVL